MALGIYFKLYAEIQEVDGQCYVKVYSNYGECKIKPRDKACSSIGSQLDDEYYGTAKITPYGPSLRGLAAYYFNAHFGGMTYPTWKDDYKEEQLAKSCNDSKFNTCL